MGMHTQLTFECSLPSNKFQFEQTSSFDLNKNWASIWVNTESQLPCWISNAYWTPRFRYNLTLTSHKKTCTLGLLWFMMLAQWWGGDMCPLNVLITATLSLFLMRFWWFFLVKKTKIPFVIHQPHIQVRKIVDFSY
jgi:hypothetical protein